MDFLKSAVASAIAKGPLANYVLAERVDIEESIWTLSNAAKRDDGTKCSVFTFDIATNRKQLPLARNALRKFRTLRHPGVLKILDTVETDTQLHIITERLTPLARQVRRTELNEEAIKWGLWSIAKTIAFINNEAASVHACLRMSSVFTGESGEWKLGGFEVLSSMADEEGMVHAHTGLVPQYNRIMPTEAAKYGWATYKKDTWPAVDAWGFACLISELCGAATPGPAQPSDLGRLPPSMQQQYKRLLNPNPKGRLAVAGFLDQGRRAGGYFSTSLISITESLDSLGLKSEGEREEFLDQLHEVAQQFPDEFLIHRILPEMLKSVEFGGGGPKVFGVVLQIATKLSDDDYEKRVLPVIVRLFASPDRALRVSLLSALPSMIERIPKSTVNDKIFPSIVTGFADMAPIVREQTVKSVLVIISKLSDRVINGELLKHLAKTANDSEPGIRTNTTICLGKIARYLGSNTRTKVLVAAFTRSLKDPFVHARTAAIMALGATVDSFSEDDCASKLLPAICPSLLDKEKIVRDQASKVVDQYMSRIRKFAEDMPDSAQPPPATNSTSNLNGGPQVGGSANDSSWAGWAISSFTNKLSTADGTIQPNARAAINGTSGAGSTKPTPSPSRSSTPSVAHRAAPQRQQPVRQITESTKLAQSFIEPELALDDDAWGAMDEADVDNDWGTIEDEAEDAFKAGSTTTASNRSSIATSTTATRTSVSASNDDNSEPDFAGWLKAQQASKVKKAPLPRGLGTNTSKANIASTSTTSNQSSKPVVKSINAPAVPKEEDDWGDAWT